MKLRNQRCPRYPPLYYPAQSSLLIRFTQNFINEGPCSDGTKAGSVEGGGRAVVFLLTVRQAPGRKGKSSSGRFQVFGKTLTMLLFRNLTQVTDCVATKELNLSYHNPETKLFTIYPSYGNLNQVP